MVFDRYPNGGGEMLLALALADHAHDDGTHIFPSIARLAEKTRQSERSVQYQLRRMEQSGWLVLVNAGIGGRRSGFGEGGRTYTRAVQHVVDGKPVPEPVLAIEQEKHGVRPVRDRESARAAMERAAAELNFDGD